MSKRFAYVKNNSISQYSVLPIQEIGGKTYHCQGVVDKLNKLNDENEQLKKERNHFEKKKTQYLTEWNTCRIQNTELKKDNQELKEAMKRMMIEMMGGKME